MSLSSLAFGISIWSYYACTCFRTMSFSKMFNDDSQDLLDNGKGIAGELLDLLSQSMRSRRNLAQSFESIADDLDNAKENVNLAKIAGTSVSILGTIGGITATALTGIYSQFFMKTPELAVKL